MKLRVLGLCMIVMGVLGGCTGTTAEPALPPDSAAAAPVSVALPSAVTIPRLRVSSTLIATGLADDNTPAVPDVHHPEQASWFDQTPIPGKVGPATLLGHVDGDHKPGVFQRIDQLRPGDQVLVDLDDGTRVTFVVTRVTTVPKKDFDPLPDGSPSPAMRAVYGDTERPELRLLTCGGSFDRAVRSYRDQVVVYLALST